MRKSLKRTIIIAVIVSMMTFPIPNINNLSMKASATTDATVTCANLVQTGISQERNLSLPNSRLVVNPFDFWQSVTTTQSDYSNRNTLPLNIGYCDPLLTTASYKGQELKDNILVYQKGASNTVTAASTYNSSWRADRLVSTPTWASGAMTATITDVFYDTKTIVRNIATTGNIAVLGVVSASAYTSFSNNTIYTVIGNAKYAVAFSQNVTSVIKFYTSMSNAISGTNGVSTPTASSTAYAIRLTTAPTGGALNIGFALDGTLATSATVSGLAVSGASADFTALLASREAYWNGLYAKVPQPINFSLSNDSRGVTAANVKNTYYDAWYVTITSLLPENPEGNYNYKSFATGKASMWIGGETSAVYQSQWDSLYAMQLYAYIDPGAAWNGFKGLISKVSNGMIAGENLPSNKAQTAWVLYNAMPDKNVLAEVIPNIESHLNWGMTEPRWIYASYTPDTTQKDIDFVTSILLDIIYLQKEYKELGNNTKVAEWQTKYNNFYALFKTWFFRSGGLYPVEIFSETNGLVDGNSSWISKSLHLPNLEPKYLTDLMALFNSKYDLTKNFCGETLIKAPEYLETYYGLMEKGETAKSKELINASIRDIVKTGWLAEVYNNPTDGASNATYYPGGVRTAQFGASLMINSVLNLNGVRIDDGLPAFHSVFSENGGVKNLTLDGVTYDIVKTGVQFSISASNNFSKTFSADSGTISSLAADRQAYPFSSSVVSAYSSVVDHSAQNNVPTLSGLWANEVYEKEDTVNNLGTMYSTDFVAIGSVIWCYYIATDSYGKPGIGLKKCTDGSGVNFIDYGIVLHTTPGAWDGTMAAFPSIYVYNGVFFLAYEGSGTSCNGDIGLATSTDGVNFTKQGKILTHGTTGWESVNIGTPDLYRMNDTWFLTYHGYDGKVCEVGVASGANIYSLTKNVSNPVIAAGATGANSGTIGRRDVTYYNGYYYMVYEISTAQPYQAAKWSHTFARSTDMLNWTTLSQNNIIPQTNYIMGNDVPAFLVIGETVWVYYHTIQNGGDVLRRARLANEPYGGTNKVIEAEAILHQNGRTDGEGWSANITDDQEGFMVYGDYASDIPQGEVTGVFKAMIDNNSANNEAVLRIEAVDMTTLKVVASREITRQMFSSPYHKEYFSLPFNNFYIGHIIEFRAYWYDKAYINMDSVLVNFGNMCRLPPSSLLFEAEDLSHMIGRAEGDGWSANIADDSAGYLVYGPYTKDIETGIRKAVFKMKIDDNSADNAIVARIEVYDVTTSRILSQTNITRKQFNIANQYQNFDLIFNHSSDEEILEFRVFWVDVAYINVDNILVEQNSPKAWIYEAEDGVAEANTRTVTADGQAIACSVAVNSAGFCVFGSDYTIEPGTYKITAVMKTLTRSALPSDFVAGWDTYYKVDGLDEVSNVGEIRDLQFATLDAWTNIELVFKTGISLTNMQIRMKSYDNVDFQVDKFIIEKIDDALPIVVEAKSVAGSFTGSFTNEGIKCVVGDGINWATYGTRVALDEGKYYVLVYVKQLQKAVNLDAPIFTFNLTYNQGGANYNSVLFKTFKQSDFSSTLGEYKAFSVPIEVPQGQRFTEAQLMVRFEGNTDIVIDRFEIFQELSFGSYIISDSIITNIATGTTAEYFIGRIKPIGAVIACSKTNAETVGTGTSIEVSFGGSSATYTAVIYGDVDGNGAVETLDLVKIKKHLLKVQALSGDYEKAGDIFHKGAISIQDLLAIKKHILGLQTIYQG